MFHIWAGSLAVTPPSVGVARSRISESDPIRTEPPYTQIEASRGIAWALVAGVAQAVQGWSVGELHD